MTHSLTPEVAERDKIEFTPFAPVPINAEIFLDVQLTPIEKTVLALAEIFRVEIERQRTPEKRREVMQQIRASKFCDALQKSRDHIRRVLSSMQKNEAVKKYVSIYFVKDKFHNAEDQIVFTFKNHRVDSIALNTVGVQTVLGTESLPFEKEILLRSYLQKSVCFSQFKPLAIAKTVDVEIGELVKGILYVDIIQTKRLREKKSIIENPVGYLINCYDEAGKFKYELKPTKYLNRNTTLSSSSNVEYEMQKNVFSRFSSKMQDIHQNKLKFIFTERNGLIYLTTIFRTTKKLNPVKWLKKLDFDFKIVSEVEVGGVQ